MKMNRFENIVWCVGIVFLSIFLPITIVSAESPTDEDSLFDNVNTSPRTVTIRGKVDPRLYVWAQSIFVPTNTEDKKSCLREKRDWVTGTHKIKPAFSYKRIIPDKNNKYSVTLPVDYVGEDLCAYRFYSIEIRIRRHQDDKLWTKFSVVNNFKNDDHIYQGTEGGYGGSGMLGKPIMPKNMRKYFQLPTNSKIRCFTIYFEYKDDSSFICFEQYEGNENGVDILKTSVIDLDINVDDSLSELISLGDNIREKDFFRDYIPPPTFIESLGKWLNDF